MPTDPNINGRPVQWSDLKTNQRKIVSDNIREVGTNLPSIARESSERLAATHERTGNRLAKVKSASAAAVSEHLQSKPVSLQTAANSRQTLYNKGIEDRRSQHPDDPHQVIPTGAGWYFEHHKEIASAAESRGFHRDHAIAASGVMSPMNSPDNEKAAVTAMMDAYSNHKVKVTPEVHEHLGKAGIDVSAHIGKEVHFDQLPPGSMAHLSDSKIRDNVPTTANLKDVSLGGTRVNITRAEHVLMGYTHPDNAVDPHSAPKVWSYVHNTRQAVPNSPDHVEYMGRVHQDAMVRSGQIDQHQQALDLYGHNDRDLPRDHLLHPNSNTVEDTWQNAATFDQPKTMAGGKTSVFKAAGSLPETYPVRGVKTRVNPDSGKKESAHPDARVGNSALTHAFNNRATQKAAEQQGRGSGTTIPPVAVQEVGWVQMRKDAGKDPAHAEALRGADKLDPLGGHIKGQGALFGDHIPGAGKTPLDRSTGPNDVHIPEYQDERELRKWQAIGNAYHGSKARAAMKLNASQFGSE